MSEGRNQWMVWTVVVAVIVVILIAFNYQGDNSDVMPLSEIFPDESMEMEGVEYEYVYADSPEAQQIPAETAASAQAPQVIKTAPVSIASSAQGKFSIQILSSKDKAATERALAKIKEQGFPNAYIGTKEISGATRFRIYVGPFTTKQEANGALPAVQNHYKDAFILSSK